MTEIKDEILDEGCINVRSNAKVHLDVWLTNDEWKQILQDREDAKKYRGYVVLFESINKEEKFPDYFKRQQQAQKDRQIVKRLEDRLKIIQNIPTNDLKYMWSIDGPDFIKELQKILGEKDG